MKPLLGERDKKQARLKFFSNHLKQGTFGSPTWSIAKLRTTGDELRCDGQHTSSVLAAIAVEEFPTNMNVTLQIYAIDSVENDGPILFDMFDNPQSARTNTDAMGIHRAHFDDLIRLDNAFLVKVANGIDFYLKDLVSNSETGGSIHRWPSRKHGFYFDDEEHRRFALWLNRWKDAKYAWMISKPGIVAEMFSDWKMQETIATTFWGYVIRFDHPEVNHETRELAEKLKDMCRSSRYKQDHFRNHAQRVWKRYRRLIEAESQISTTVAA